MAERFMKKGDVIDMAITYFPSFLRSRKTALSLQAWMDGKQHDYTLAQELDADHPHHGLPYAPTNGNVTEEYENLTSLAPNAFAGLVVASLQQTAYIEGIRRPGVQGSIPAWETFRRNRWLSKQSSIHRAAIGLSTAYGLVIPGEDPLTRTKMAKMLARSPTKMAAFYDNDDDEWPTVAIEAEPRYDQDEGTGRWFQNGWFVQVYDEYVIHRLILKKSTSGGAYGPVADAEDFFSAEHDDWTYVDHVEHGLPVVPVARCVNRINLDGRATGEIEPVLPLLRRIDQDTFDRLIIQRFGAWQVRYIAGMAKPTKEAEARAQALKLSIDRILISTNEKSKFGTLPAGPLGPMIEATDADLRLLAAISQTPPHHLLGLSSNLQAEALAAAESGLQRKSFDFRTNAGEFHEQMARLTAMAEGDFVTAAASDISVRWKDTESRSMTQAADALGKLAIQLKVPVEMLWEKIPGWTDDDVQRAKELVEDGDFVRLVNELMAEGEGGEGGENPKGDQPRGDS